MSIGVQEARTPQGRYNAPHYHILASGAKCKRAPLYGCELWIHKTLPIATDPQGKPIVLGKAILTVQHADPRRLLVEAKIGQYVYAFIVLHAPSLATAAHDVPDPIEAATQWWDETAALYAKYVTAGAQWVFIDANAPLDDGDGLLIGPHGAEPANHASARFESFIQLQQLMVPSTFASIHEGPTTTWTHSTGKKSRKDYILLSQDVAKLASKSWVEVHHDSTFAHEDHLPVVLQCAGWLPTSSTHPTIGWDDRAMLDPAQVDAFQRALHTLPLPAWDIGIDDHAALYEQQLLALGRQFFARKPRKERPITLSSQTLEAIAFKRHVLDIGRQTNSMHLEDFKVELRSIEKTVARLVRDDIQGFYNDLLKQIQASGEISNHRLVFRLLHRLGRKKGAGANGPRPLPMIQKPDGTTASSYLDQQRTWMHQFASIEAGVPRTWDELEQQHAALHPSQPCNDLEPAAFPGPWRIRMLIAKLHRDKVPGPNLVPPALLKAGGSVVAKQLSVMFTKAAAGAQEPLHWKGGILIPLWKGKLAPHLAEGYRSIFISNYTTKLYHQCFRAHLVDAWEQTLTHLQCGGRKGIGADVAHHIVQCHQSWCKEKAVPSAALFFDLKSAFYMVLRQAFTQIPSHDDAFMAAMYQVGLSPAEVHKLITNAATDDAVKGLPRHMQHILHDLLHNTYFTVQGLTEPCQTTRGTRPGDPIADVLFNLCMHLILTDFRATMEHSNDVPWLGQASPVSDLSDIPSIPPTGFIDVTFVDDCVVLIHGRSNDSVANTMKAVVQAMDKAAATRGLSINYERGKTEALWTILGKGARQMKQTLHEAGQTLQWAHEGIQYTIPLCHTYKHLGTWLQAHHKHTREILARSSAAKQQYGQLARPFFTKKCITLPVKSAIFQSLVLSKMLYNVHTWTSVTPKHMQTWTNHLKAPAGTLPKGLLMAPTRFMHSTDEMMACAGILPLMDQVHANRLRFLARLLNACPPHHLGADAPHHRTSLLDGTMHGLVPMAALSL